MRHNDSEKKKENKETSTEYQLPWALISTECEVFERKSSNCVWLMLILFRYFTR